MQHRRIESTVRRLLAGGLAIVVMTALAALAGVGLARGSISAAQYQYGKVTICHKTGSKKHPNVTITVSRAALASHLKHGDTEGACPKPKPAASNKGKGGSEKKGSSGSKGSEKGSEKGAEKGAEKKAPEKGADPPAKEKEQEKGEKEKGEKEHGGGGENGGGQGNGNGGGGGKGKGK